MKFPSIAQLWYSFTEVCNRFTIPILFTIVATVAGLVLSYDLESLKTEQLLIKIIYLCNFGLSLSLAVCLYTETKSLKRPKFYIANGVVFLILFFIYFILDPNIHQADIIVLLVLGFAFHLLVAFAAFTSKEENNGFWQINKTFFLRFATSALYSVVLFAGLSIALLSVHTLFDIKWDGKVYLRLWIIIVGLFNTIFFLSGIQKPLKDLNHDVSYPKGLKIFTQYVLIPLSSIYLVILLAYEVKIIFQWSLPQNSVAILILGYAVFGILSILLVHPIRNNDGNRWINWYSKSFYLLMLPLLILLSIAIVKRVIDYGITESRYLLIALAIWLAFITIYFLLKGRDQIRIIPISLFVFSLLIVEGPWGIKSVSKLSQSNRLTHFIAEKPSDKRNKEIRNLVRYLNNNFGTNSLQAYVKFNLDSVEQKFIAKSKKDDISKWEIKSHITDTVLNTLKISEVDIYEYDHQKNYSNEDQDILSIDGAIKVIAFTSNPNSDEVKKAFTLEKNKVELSINNDYKIKLKGIKNLQVTFNAEQLLNRLAKIKNLKNKEENNIDYLVPNPLMAVTQDVGNYKFVCRFETLNASYMTAPETLNSLYYNGFLIIYPKK